MKEDNEVAIVALQMRMINEIERQLKLSLPLSLFQAFLLVPRHLFLNPSLKIDIFRAYSLEVIHLLKGRGKDEFLSLMPDPVIAAQTLLFLDLQKGQRILEIGTGSGWNAALMANQVGEEGLVVSLEIHEKLVSDAKKNLLKAEIKNVEVCNADGSAGDLKKSLYDSIIFTASSFDFPYDLHAQMRLGGKLVYILKTPNFCDQLLFLLRREDRFEVMNSLNVSSIMLQKKKQEVEAIKSSDLKAKKRKHSVESAIVFKEGLIYCFIEENFDFYLSMRLPDLDVKRKAIVLEGHNVIELGIMDSKSGESIIIGPRETRYSDKSLLEKVRETFERWKEEGRPKRTDFSMSFHKKGTIYPLNGSDIVISLGQSDLLLTNKIMGKSAGNGYL